MVLICWRAFSSGVIRRSICHIRPEKRGAILLPRQSTSNANLDLCSGCQRDDVGRFEFGCAPTFFWKSYSDNGIVGGMSTEDHANAAASGALAPISKSVQALQFGGSTAIHPESFRGRERRGCKARSGGRNRAHRARLQRRVAGVGKNMCFCETNPPFFERFFGATATANDSYGGKVRKIRWVRLPRSTSKANPRWEVNGVENLQSGNVCGRAPKKTSG